MKNSYCFRIVKNVFIHVNSVLQCMINTFSLKLLSVMFLPRNNPHFWEFSISHNPIFGCQVNSVTRKYETRSTKYCPAHLFLEYLFYYYSWIIQKFALERVFTIKVHTKIENEFIHVGEHNFRFIYAKKKIKMEVE